MKITLSTPQLVIPTGNAILSRTRGQVLGLSVNLVFLVKMVVQEDFIKDYNPF